MYYGTVKDDLSSPLGVEKKKSKGKDRSDSKKKDANGPVPDRIPLPAPLIFHIFYTFLYIFYTFFYIFYTFFIEHFWWTVI